MEGKNIITKFDTDKAGSKFVKWIKGNIVGIFLAVLSVYFLFSGAVKFTLSDLDWWEKVCFICTTLIFGVVISSLVAEGGYSSGKKSQEFISTRAEAVALCEEIIMWKEEADLYVSKKIDNDIKNERTGILHKSGIRYSEVFDENGVMIMKRDAYRKLTKNQKKAVNAASRIKKAEFTLFGFTSVKGVGRKKAPDEVKRRAKKGVADFATRSIIAVASGSVMFSFIGLSWESVIYSFFQLMIWMGSGLINRIGNYNFIVNDVRGYDMERIWYLKEFKALPQAEKEALRVELGKKGEEEPVNEGTTATAENNE